MRDSTCTRDEPRSNSEFILELQQRAWRRYSLHWPWTRLCWQMLPPRSRHSMHRLLVFFRGNARVSAIPRIPCSGSSGACSGKCPHMPGARHSLHVLLMWSCSHMNDVAAQPNLKGDLFSSSPSAMLSSTVKASRARLVCCSPRQLSAHQG